MIYRIGKCPYCDTVLAVDLVNSKFAFNPESRRPVCAHVAYIDSRLTYWGEGCTVVDCAMGLFYESVEVLKLRDEFDLREYMSKLRRHDQVNPQAEYVTSEVKRDCREQGVDVSKDPTKEYVDFEAWLVFTRDANSFFRACEADWTRSRSAQDS
jgi:hypothetical protein